MRNILKVCALIGLLGAGVQASGDNLQSLKNMERERSQMVQTFLATDISSLERQHNIETSQRRLVDLERMVLRDDQLLGSTNKLVRLAFKNYDLSFLVHASNEAKQAPIELWLGEIGLSNDDILSASMGRR